MHSRDRGDLKKQIGAEKEKASVPNHSQHKKYRTKDKENHEGNASWHGPGKFLQGSHLAKGMHEHDRMHLRRMLLSDSDSEESGSDNKADLHAHACRKARRPMPTKTEARSSDRDDLRRSSAAALALIQVLDIGLVNDEEFKNTFDLLSESEQDHGEIHGGVDARMDIFREFVGALLSSAKRTLDMVTWPVSAAQRAISVFGWPINCILDILITATEALVHVLESANQVPEKKIQTKEDAHAVTEAPATTHARAPDTEEAAAQTQRARRAAEALMLGADNTRHVRGEVEAYDSSDSDLDAHCSHSPLPSIRGHGRISPTPWVSKRAAAVAAAGSEARAPLHVLAGVDASHSLGREAIETGGTCASARAHHVREAEDAVLELRERCSSAQDHVAGLGTRASREFSLEQGGGGDEGGLVYSACEALDLRARAPTIASQRNAALDQQQAETACSAPASGDATCRAFTSYGLDNLRLHSDMFDTGEETCCQNVDMEAVMSFVPREASCEHESVFASNDTQNSGCETATCTAPVVCGNTCLPQAAWHLDTQTEDSAHRFLETLYGACQAEEALAAQGLVHGDVLCDDEVSECVFTSTGRDYAEGLCGAETAYHRCQESRDKDGGRLGGECVSCEACSEELRDERLGHTDTEEHAEQRPHESVSSVYLVQSSGTVRGEGEAEELPASAERRWAKQRQHKSVASGAAAEAVTSLQDAPCQQDDDTSKQHKSSRNSLFSGASKTERSIAGNDLFGSFLQTIVDNGAVRVGSGLHLPDPNSPSAADMRVTESRTLVCTARDGI
jgi:hypothetical protein